MTDHSDTHWLLEHVGIPDHEHGDFPNADNPNSIGEQHHDYYIPKTPNWLGTPGCLPMGEYRMPDCLPVGECIHITTHQNMTLHNCDS